MMDYFTRGAEKVPPFIMGGAGRELSSPHLLNCVSRDKLQEGLSFIAAVFFRLQGVVNRGDHLVLTYYIAATNELLVQLIR